MRERWCSFDCLKGLACAAVVLIHYNFDGDLGIAVKAFCRFGVPVFFMISGFFFLTDEGMNEVIVIKKIRHILRILFAAGIFYGIFTILFNIIVDKEWNLYEFVIKHITAGKIVKFFISNDPFIYSHLWFLMALVYCYSFSLILFEKNKNLSWSKILAPLLLFCYSLLQEFGRLLDIQRSVPIPEVEEHVYLFNIFIFRALPFFLFGVVLRIYKPIVEKIPISSTVLFVFALSGGICAIFERFFIDESQFFIGTYITVAALFILSIRERTYNNKALAYIGRELSLYIYVLHIAIGKGLDFAFQKLNIIERHIYASGRGVIILCSSIFIAAIINAFKKKILQSTVDLNA